MKRVEDLDLELQAIVSELECDQRKRAKSLFATGIVLLGSGLTVLALSWWLLMTQGEVDVFVPGIGIAGVMLGTGFITGYVIALWSKRG